MPLVYSFVARGDVVIADHAAFSGNFDTVGIQCLQNVKNPEARFTITCDGHTFNFLNDGFFTYLVVADEAYGRQIPLACLDKIKDQFAKFADKGRTAAAHSLDKTFGPKLKEQMDYCMSHPEEVSKVASVQKQVDEVKNIMVENIEKVLERGEKIELLVDKTDDLRFQAEKFQKTGRQLRNRMWWANLKMKLVIALVVILLAVVLFAIICFSGKNCLKK